MNAAERIYNASTREDGSSARLAEKLARRMEDDIASFRLPPGDALGSLRDLSERYSVGKAVTREAIGLLERRGLGSLRPGPCGGFIVKQPQFDFIGGELANYFRSVGITLPQLLDAREATDLMIARLAAANRPSPIGLARITIAGKSRGFAGHLAVRNELARITREPAVMPLVRCLNDLTEDFFDPDSEDRTRSAEPLATDGLIQALTCQDEDLLTVEMNRLQGDLAARLQPADRPSELPAIETSRLSNDRTLAASVARRLAGEIVREGTTGQRLGSEWDLCERFSVSRLTLRQAIRLLQDSGLVECRRGRGQGLVVRNRQGTGAIRLVLAYLIGQQMDVKTAGTILFQLNCFAPALAVCRANAEQRQKLETLLVRVEKSDPFDRYDLLGLVHCVSGLAQNPIIDLFSRCLAAYEARFHPSLTTRLPASVHTNYFRLVRTLLDEIPVGGEGHLAWAKKETARVMLDMSRNRPI